MSNPVAESEWRQKRWEWHGPRLHADLKSHYPNRKTFAHKDVAKLPALSHLAERTAYDVSMAVCRELEVRRKLKRQGKMMYLR
jgi:hypothetical protein